MGFFDFIKKLLLTTAIINYISMTRWSKSNPFRFLQNHLRLILISKKVLNMFCKEKPLNIKGTETWI